MRFGRPFYGGWGYGWRPFYSGLLGGLVRSALYSPYAYGDGGYPYYPYYSYY